MRKLGWILPFAMLLGCSSSLSTVNRDILIAPSSRTASACRSVNGEIQIGDHSETRSVSTVNGSIRIGMDCLVDGNLKSVNGNVICAKRTQVRCSVETVNGRIELEGTEVGHDVSTINGEILLTDVKVVGNIVIGKSNSSGDSSTRKPLVITLMNGTVVQGEIKIEDEGQPVEVRKNSNCTVLGGFGRAKIVQL